MTESELQSLIRGYLADQGIGENEVYIKRGRRFAHLDDDTLRAAWATAFGYRWPIFGNPVEQDLACELSLRGIDLPLELVRHEWEAMEQFVKRALEVEALEVADMDEEAADALLAKLADFQERLAKPRH